MRSKPAPSWAAPCVDRRPGLEAHVAASLQLVPDPPHLHPCLASVHPRTSPSEVTEYICASQNFGIHRNTYLTYHMPNPLREDNAKPGLRTRYPRTVGVSESIEFGKCCLDFGQMFAKFSRRALPALCPQPEVLPARGGAGPFAESRSTEPRSGPAACSWALYMKHHAGSMAR